MKDVLVFLLAALVSVSLLGCSKPAEEHFNPRKFAKNHLQSFKLPGNTFPELYPDLDRRFSGYARECSWGIPDSGLKLAELYKSTLKPDGEHYLYFQQAKFSDMYTYCWLTMASRAKAVNEKRPDLFKKALEELRNAAPGSPRDIMEIIYAFYRIGDPTSAQNWISKLNFRERGDVPAMFELGKFLFQADDMQLQGYTMVETAASMGYQDAMFQLTSPEYTEFRENHPQLRASYQKLMNRGRIQNANDTDDEGDPGFGTSLFGKK